MSEIIVINFYKYVLFKNGFKSIHLNAEQFSSVT